MAKKSKLARAASRRRARRNPADGIAKTALDVGVGFGGYAATRFLARIAYTKAAQRWPGAAKHVHAAASVIGAAAVYLGTEYVEKAQEFHEAASLGAGIAAAQTLWQTYAPSQFAYVTADVVGNLAAESASPATSIDVDVPDPTLELDVSPITADDCIDPADLVGDNVISMEDYAG